MPSKVKLPPQPRCDWDHDVQAVRNKYRAWAKKVRAVVQKKTDKMDKAKAAAKSRVKREYVVGGEIILNFVSKAKGQSHAEAAEQITIDLLEIHGGDPLALMSLDMELSPPVIRILNVREMKKGELEKRVKAKVAQRRFASGCDEEDDCGYPETATDAAQAYNDD